MSILVLPGHGIGPEPTSAEADGALRSAVDRSPVDPGLRAPDLGRRTCPFGRAGSAALG